MQTKKDINALVAEQKAFFATGHTVHHLKGRMVRINALDDLQTAVKMYEKQLVQALHEDLGKSEFEAYATELVPVYQELDYIFKKGGAWFKDRRVLSNKLTMHGMGKVKYEPKGTVLIMAPWNYPVQLTLIPLMSAIIAGNTAVVKPSELAPKTAEVLIKMISETFESKYIAAVSGGPEVAKKLTEADFDHIFFTGSTRVGREVMAAAAKNLTTVTLELGGKSPCIVTTNGNIYKAAKSIVWAKLVNCGQTCVAPDYVLVAEEQKEAFVSSLIFAIHELYGQEPLESADYGRIVNRQHFDRLNSYIEAYRGTGKLAFGGQVNKDTLQIAPTILTDIGLEDPVMQDEIFGPILPVFTYDTVANAVRFINSRPTPLVCYLFSESDDNITLVDNKLRCGALCINDTMSHMLNPALPFGGVGDSGFGRYHGYAGFQEFSVPKTVFRARGSANALRYPPYTDSKLQKLKQLFKLGGEVVSQKDLR
ncbi:MAG: aldehyde dehydrogenase family protein [Firmicutes bacterium]|nr:aldehyde dehydrogenase family protein [Bacillota bacterium]